MVYYMAAVMKYVEINCLFIMMMHNAVIYSGHETIKIWKSTQILLKWLELIKIHIVENYLQFILLFGCVFIFTCVFTGSSGIEFLLNIHTCRWLYLLTSSVVTDG